MTDCILDNRYSKCEKHNVEYVSRQTIACDDSHMLVHPEFPCPLCKYDKEFIGKNKYFLERLFKAEKERSISEKSYWVHLAPELAIPYHNIQLIKKIKK